MTFLDGWLILDGHDRAVAALAEGAQPVCMVLCRVPDEPDWRRTADELTEAHEQRMSRPAEYPTRQRATLERGFGEALSALPYDARTGSCPLTGGLATWDDLAADVMLQFPRD
ncbi:hypothetical protein OH768_37280 [Streptomyces sp. NBC_01622]|uniref:hypothetical protein n=1 Tax=Streptomyces sp. NBC_01622 TaxID=2975903 RepID=UPI0038671621|nr:hypothetical protein OH768_37280 [Streptomyces sp. NBC_01622]